MYKVKIFIEDGIVKCASGICTVDSCPRYKYCEYVTIEIKDEKLETDSNK